MYIFKLLKQDVNQLDSWWKVELNQIRNKRWRPLFSKYFSTFFDVLLSTKYKTISNITESFQEEKACIKFITF